MSYPVIAPRDEDRSESAGRVVGTFFAFLSFAAGIALFAVSFTGEDWTRWTFVGAILAVTLAFAIPTTILPALEGD
ncbi:hypothetical protein [Cellulomonas fimi]|uniref:Uncharacterized protein n=1 Tax=Cellulomonas fimi (strain ATCC 484 / DSM 20113 / JCM 1341 / CCUG 24087 / LMG 16345 / NBRC 15513 / NCIMB 8980 / NCTC 7547 / NRS-133) TaxID=590998 RepID=F4H4X9_CELFA|nr:hypothetical protein [Cellulomonas fimi]AEE45459.1 hypothetical protein Celf_1324 [Cellulomonas fimi ATCC 484]NNH07314.1 hypothetical protein [Cellulomonas fimi]VEH29463.1 Uncharacterised protein [Cellulomonas fimi]